MTNLKNKILGTAVALGLTLGANGCGDKKVYNGSTSLGKTKIEYIYVLDRNPFYATIEISKGDTTWTIHDYMNDGIISDKFDWVSVAVKGKAIQRYEEDNFCDNTNTRFNKNGSNLEKAVYAKSREILRDRFEPMYKQILREATEKSVLKVRYFNLNL